MLVLGFTWDVGVEGLREDMSELVGEAATGPDDGRIGARGFFSLETGEELIDGSLIGVKPVI